MVMWHTNARDISAGDFDSCIPLSQVTGETADISEYLLMCYHIFKNSKILSRFSIQRVTHLELQTDGYIASLATNTIELNVFA